MGRNRQRQEERDAAIFALGAKTGAARERQRGFLKRLARIARRLLLAEVKEASGIVEREGPQTALKSILRLSRGAWRQRWQTEVSDALEDVMDDAPLRTTMGSVKPGFNVSNPELASFFEDYKLRLATQVTDTTREDIEGIIRKASEEGLSVPDTARLIREKGEEFSKSRSETIARTELHRAALSAAEIQARRSGVVTGRTWLATKDARTRSEHRVLDGVTVGLDEEFPGGLHPATEINCRCSLIFNV